jgi:hypothetical protein
MKKMFKTLASGWIDLFRGAGQVPNPEPGNMANAPADPSVVTGNYQFIQHQMFDGPSSDVTDVPEIPPQFVDWGQYPLNVFGLSGLEGGGSTGDVPQADQGATLYYDSESGMYIDLNQLSGVRA